MNTPATICLFALMLAWAALLSPALPAQAQNAAAPQPWLPAAAQTRRAVLAELASKAGQAPYDKALPLLQKAEGELAQTDPQARSAAIDDAYDAALLVMTKTQDHALAAKLFDGFLLVALRYASPDPALYDGRLHLLKTAVGVYGQAGQPDRQMAALHLLRQEAGDNENLQDWVSVQLASLYTQRKQYEPAMEALGAVRTPVMMGPVSAIPDLQQKLSDQELDKEQAAEAKPVHAKPVHAKPVHTKIVRKKPARKKHASAHLSLH